MSNTIKEGDWFIAVDGLAIAERLFDFYFEEFDDIPEDKNLGDYNFSMVQYRLFCDFDGLPIRRNRCKVFNHRFSRPLDFKYKKVLNKSIKDHPKEYASFVKFLNIKKEFRGWTALTFGLGGNKDDSIHYLNQIKNELPSVFTFDVFLKVASDNKRVIDMTHHIPNNWPFGIPLYVRISLSYTYGNYFGKRILYDRFEFRVEENAIKE